MEQFIKHRQAFKRGILIGAVVLCGLVYLIRQGGFGGDGSVGFTAEEPDSFAAGALTQTPVAQEPEQTREPDCYVFVCGQVNAPGVYQCAPQTRVYALIEMAGGFAPEADETALNLVETVVDGQKLYVPRQGEQGQTAGPEAGQSVKVNLNTATKEQLMTLPGIGASKAADIIAYRNEHGRFVTEEDLMQVAGIKGASYEKLKAYICVS